MRTVRVTIRGLVQGVFFRASCAEEAARLAISGWVRNTADGRLEAVFHGSDEAVERMIAWCREGPRHARVEGVDVRPEPAFEGSGFRVER
jgi:acylphosphatase